MTESQTQGRVISTSTQTKPRKPRVFPLHMTSFEHYMLADDRASYPMSFIVQLEFSGKLHEKFFEEAIHAAQQRHPLMMAIVGPGKGGKECWITAPNSKPIISWFSIDEPIDIVDGSFIDLRKEVGLRIYVCRDSNRACVTIQFHHATCDGIGSYQFLGDVLYEYAKRTGDRETAAPPELCPRKLRNRGQASYNINNFRLANGKYQRTWDEALKHLVRSNIVLKSQKALATTNPEFPGIQTHTFDRNEYKNLRLLAQSRGQVLNDMLVEKLFETLHQWNSSQKTWNRPKHACIMMPLNLREINDNEISACNVVAHAFLRRSAQQLDDKTKFRRELSSELLLLKSSRHKIRFMHMIAGGHYFYPRTLKWSLDWKRSLATAILSNTGDPTKQFLVEFPRSNGAIRCGNITLEDISGVPPLRPGTNAAISIFTYRRKLKLCLRCDPRQFSAHETRRLLSLFAAKIESDPNPMVAGNRRAA